ncbi:hypothetical protein AB7C87_06830 [Natrarchaeobius sp. A-rgal3]|uniref:hypothetical protein n=1 Tax=Natrarchaeobius versutus TaxID=1679078 RepID=UPI00350FC6BE
MVPRRHVLAGCGAAIAATAGCLGDEMDNPPSNGADSATADDANAATADGDNPPAGDDEADAEEPTVDDAGDDAADRSDEAEPSPDNPDAALVTILRRDENGENDDPEHDDTGRDDVGSADDDTGRDDRSGDDLERGDDGPTDDEVVLVTHGDVTNVGAVGRDDQRGNYYLPIQFSDDGTTRFTGGLVAVDAFEEPEEQELVVYVDGEVLGTYGLGQNLSNAIRSGRWDGNFRIVALEEAPLVELREDLEPSA